MTLWSKLAALVTLMPVRLPEERRLDHRLNNYLQSMDGAEERGLKIVQELSSDPTRQARAEQREANRRAAEAIAQRSIDQKDRGVARIEAVARVLRDNR